LFLAGFVIFFLMFARESELVWLAPAFMTFVLGGILTYVYLPSS